MIIDAISDLHGHYPQLEGGALLIVAGDCLKRETIAEKEIFFDWLADQNYKNKILVGGNHDNFLRYFCAENHIKKSILSSEVSEAVKSPATISKSPPSN